MCGGENGALIGAAFDDGAGVTPLFKPVKFTN